MREITLENSSVLRGKIYSLKAPDKTLSMEGVAADAGGGEPMNIMNPYLAAYCWKRTA